MTAPRRTCHDARHVDDHLAALGAAALARHRRAAAGAFFTQGFVFISLTTRLPTVQDHWGYSDTTLSLLLLMMVLLAGLGSVLAETACKRVDSAAILRVGLLGIAVAVPVFALAPDQPVFIASMALYGVALGAVDATTNMQAVALEHLYDRPILPSFHGAWTLGGADRLGPGAGDGPPTALGRPRSSPSCRW